VSLEVLIPDSLVAKGRVSTTKRLITELCDIECLPVSRVVDVFLALPLSIVARQTQYFGQVESRDRGDIVAAAG
jgi:hypothetical protein